METELASLTLNEEEDEIFEIPMDPISGSERSEFQLVGCFLMASIIHFLAMKSTMANLWHLGRGVQIRDLGDKRFNYERLSLFCFYCGCLGHSDSFCEAKMSLGVEIAELGWDLSLRAQSCRALSMNSIWLRGEDEEHREGDKRSNWVPRNRIWNADNNGKSGKVIDPVLGFNMEGGSLSLDSQKENIQSELMQTRIEHDLEDGVLIGEEGKKRTRGVRDGFSEREDMNCLMVRSRRLMESNQLSSVAAKRQAYRNESWDVLKSLNVADDVPWFIYGDFNEIMYGSEKKGGLPSDERRMNLFRRTLEDCQLSDIGYSGRWFIWERGNLPEMNIREWLDRGVANVSWISMFPKVKMKHLVHSFSDHCPLLTDTSIVGGSLKNKIFKIEA
ncbi:hypothetical protein PVK06_035516 [Gossypium arboreum]|uniref:Zinc knuckle CX2CX4HX4C domain-containing protein n=1 Tax=Gossypium arboreum TaxID=29729 RepID=A0ABR0NJ86_GOSAR|nr:hypothetical protein PVK06_035516 [Gossypium arboreum]